MSNIELFKDTVLSSDRSNVREKVQSLLSILPKRYSSVFTQIFYGLRLVSPEGIFFTLSIQAGECHYSSPRMNLDHLMMYTDVEIGIVPDTRNSDLKYKCGTSYDWNADVEASERRQVQEGEVSSWGTLKQGWLMPSHIGFTHLRDVNDDIMGYQEMDHLIEDLTDFFIRGGRIEADHQDTKEWIALVSGKVQVQHNDQVDTM